MVIEQAAEADLKEKFEETLFLHRRVRAAQRESREPDYEDVQRIGQNLRFFKAVLPHPQFISLTQQGLHLPPALVLDYIQASVRKDSPVVQERVGTPDNVARLEVYASLDEPTRIFVQEKAQDIHSRLKRTAEDIIAIGQNLIEVKAKLGHGLFMQWIDLEFEMSQWIVNKFIQVAKRKDKFVNLTNISISVLYELAAPSTPDTVIEMVDTGQIPATIPAIREAKQAEKPTEREVQAIFDAPSSTPTYGPYLEGRSLIEEEDEQSAMEQVEAAGRVLQQVVDVKRKEVDQRLTQLEQRHAHVMQVMGSSESPEWYTPQEIVQLSIELLGEIELDPCSNSLDTPNVPARNHYTKEDNGLLQPWSGKVYLNPPYGSEIPQWVNKLVKAYDDKQVEEAIALLPARIDTQWFQPLYDFLMCNVRGRVQYENSPYSAPFPCVIVYLGERVEDFIRTFQHKGPIMRRIG